MLRPAADSAYSSVFRDGVGGKARGALATPQRDAERVPERPYTVGIQCAVDGKGTDGVGVGSGDCDARSPSVGRQAQCRAGGG